MAQQHIRRNGRSAFLALKNDIEAELAAGAYAKWVHAKYEQQLGFGYRQFLKYLKRYRLHDASNLPPPAKADPPRPKSGPARQEPRRAGPRTLPTFEYDPMDIYRKPK